MLRRLMRGGHEVVATIAAEAVAALAKDGAVAATLLAAAVKHCRAPRMICLMVPAGVVSALALLFRCCRPIIVIDGGNSHTTTTSKRAWLLWLRILLHRHGHIGRCVGTRAWLLPDDRRRARAGAASHSIFRTLAPTVAVEQQAASNQGTAHLGYLHCGSCRVPANIVKMIHNGIEYGLMAAYAEGCDIARQCRRVDGGARRRNHATA